LKKSISK